VGVRYWREAGERNGIKGEERERERESCEERLREKMGYNASGHTLYNMINKNVPPPGMARCVPSTLCP